MVRYSEPMQMSADVKFRMTDTAPLVALFDAQKDVSRFVENLMTIQDIEGKTSLKVDDHGSEIAGLEIAGEDFLALAEMALREEGKNGILYVRLHGFSVGVAFDRGEKDVDLIRARAWYEKQRARRRVVR
jgi:hypothetical protein